MTITKRCTKCWDVKDVKQFQKQSRSKDGYKSECRECSNIRAAKRYKQNPKILLQNKKWMDNHPKEHSKHAAAYRKSPQGRFARYLADTLYKILSVRRVNVRDIVGTLPGIIFKSLVASQSLNPEEFGKVWTVIFPDTQNIDITNAREKLNWKNLQISFLKEPAAV